MDDDLEHYGIKGMKWGVRKDDVKAKARKENAKAKEFRDKVSQGVGKKQDTQSFGLKVGNKKLIDIRKEKKVPVWKRDTSPKEASKILLVKHKDKTIVELRSNNKILKAGRFYIHESWVEGGGRWGTKVAKKYKDAHWVDGKIVLR